MSPLDTKLVNRLIEADSPYEFKNWEHRDGYYVAACRLTPEDVPGLIDVVLRWGDEDWFDDPMRDEFGDEALDLLPVTAWRALGDLKSADAVQPLVQFLHGLHDEKDDWTLEELPHVFGKIGEASLEPLAQVARSEDRPEFIRTIAVRGLGVLAGNYPETRDRVVACLTPLMAQAQNNDRHFNTSLLNVLVDQNAVEAAEAIERAFAGDFLDVGFLGDWDDVRKMLGVAGLGLEMPRHPHNSLDQVRKAMGIGVFSPQALFGLHGIEKVDPQQYIQRALKVYSTSSEAEMSVARHGNLRWVEALLQFGIQYLGRIVDAMTLACVQEFVLEHVPRKFVVGHAEAPVIVGQLGLFWEYVNRVFQFPAAAAILDWLNSRGVVAQVASELSDESNFGIAKSLFTRGEKAGYNMASEEGAARFAIAYNRALQQSASAPERRVGRNDPCYCGSGKKFKKCCGRPQ